MIFEILSLFLVSDLDTSSDVIVSGCFDRILRVWSFPDCEHLRTIDAKHAVNCVSVCKGQIISEGDVSVLNLPKKHLSYF